MVCFNLYFLEFTLSTQEMGATPKTCPKSVDFFMGFVANNPKPSTGDDFTVRYGCRGRYMVIYTHIIGST